MGLLEHSLGGAGRSSLSLILFSALWASSTFHKTYAYETIPNDQIAQVCLQHINAAQSLPEYKDEKILTVRSIDGQGEVFLADLLIGNELNLSRTQDINEIAASFSPEGLRVAVAADASRVDDSGTEVKFDGISVVNADGTNYRPFLQINSFYPKDYYLDSPPIWSPDGSRLALVRTAIAGRDQLEVMRSDGTQNFRLNIGQPDVVQANITDLSFSPDSLWLAMAVNIPSGEPIKKQAFLYLIGVEGATFQTLYQPLANQSETIKNLKWLPQNNLLSFEHYVSDSSSEETMRIKTIEQTGGITDITQNCQI